MPTIKEVASEFLANKRVAVTGVSREAKGHGSNVVYKRLRDRATRSSPSTRTRTRSRAIAATTTCARSLMASTLW
jgi:hypothetical protein